MRPCAISASTLAILTALQCDVGLRGVKRIWYDWASMFLRTPSIQPTHKASSTDSGQVTLAKRRYRLALELQVSDNGPGIPAEIKDTLFFPLVSGREGGSGLGLTLAQTFVQHHHGVIECDSQPGRTIFTIILPIEPATVST